MKLRWLQSLVLGALVAAGASAPAQAAIAGCNLSTIQENVTTFSTTVTQPQTAITNSIDKMVTVSESAGQSLFKILATIEIGWFLIETVGRRKSIHDMLGSVSFRILSLMTMAALLTAAGNSGWVQGVISDFSTFGQDVGSSVASAPMLAVTNTATTASLLSEGITTGASIVACPEQAVAAYMSHHTSLIQLPMDTVIMLSIIIPYWTELCLAVYVVLVYIYLTAQLMLAYIEAAIVLSAGVFVLGFSGSRWTHSFANAYWKYALQAGFKIFTIQLVAGMGSAMIQNAVNNAVEPFFARAMTASGSISAVPLLTLGITEVGSILCITVLVLILAIRIPALSQSFISGTTAIELNDVARGAVMVGAAVASGGAVGAAAGAAAVGGAARAGAAAFNAAKSAISAGGSMAPGDGGSGNKGGTMSNSAAQTPAPPAAPAGDAGGAGPSGGGAGSKPPPPPKSAARTAMDIAGGAAKILKKHVPTLLQEHQSAGRTHPGPDHHLSE